MKLSVVASVLVALGHTTAALPAPADHEATGPSLLEAPEHLDDIIEHLVFKRDHVLTPRDFELAEMHGVDINTMYKHTVYKRGNGDDYTLWVHNSFNDTAEGDEESPEAESTSQLAARQNVRVINNSQQNHRNIDGGNRCRRQNIHGTTHPNAAFTGGANAIIRWADSQNGRFYADANCCRDPKRVNLIVAGTNSGANIRFGIGVHPSNAAGYTIVGSRDVGDVTRTSRDSYQRKYGNRWRVQSHGAFRCDHDGWWASPGGWVEWVLHRSVERA